MREIKFRAWDGTRFHFNDMLEHFQFHIISGKAFAPTAFDGLIVTGWPIEQYTGLKDANGVEIYEGDVVRDGGNVGEVKIGRVRDMTINCDEYSLEYCGVYMDIRETDIENRCDFGNWVIIDNIHEKPELLEQS